VIVPSAADLVRRARVRLRSELARRRIGGQASTETG